jgi:hypothetical protein
MGTITRSLSNNITTGGVILPAGITNSSVSAVTSFANASGGTLILLSTQTASNSATISFTTGLDSTYDEYIFKVINAHPATNDAKLEFNMSTDGGSNYNVTKTTTYILTYHDEIGNADSILTYDTPVDLAQSTAFQQFCFGIGEDSHSASGELTLFNPSSTTYVKHFMVKSNNRRKSIAYLYNNTIAGYCNTTSAVNSIRFQMTTGNIDDGIFKMYGVKKS